MSLASLTVDISLGLAKLEADSGKAAQIINRDAVNMARATERADAAVRKLTQAYTTVGVESKIVAAAAAGASDSALKLFAIVASGAGAFATVGASGSAAFKAIGTASESSAKAFEDRILLIGEKTRQVTAQVNAEIKSAGAQRESGTLNDDTLKQKLADIRTVEAATRHRIAEEAAAEFASLRAVQAERIASAKGATGATSASSTLLADAQTKVFAAFNAAQTATSTALAGIIVQDQVRIRDAQKLTDTQNGLTATYRTQLAALRELRDAGSITPAQFKRAGAELVAKQPAVQQRLDEANAIAVAKDADIEANKQRVASAQALLEKLAGVPVAYKKQLQALQESLKAGDITPKQFQVGVLQATAQRSDIQKFKAQEEEALRSLAESERKFIAERAARFQTERIASAKAVAPAISSASGAAAEAQARVFLAFSVAQAQASAALEVAAARDAQALAAAAAASERSRASQQAAYETKVAYIAKVNEEASALFRTKDAQRELNALQAGVGASEARQLAKFSGDREFIASLDARIAAEQRLRDTIGKTEAEILKQDAAERNLSNTTAKRIALIERLSTENQKSKASAAQTKSDDAYLQQLEREATAIGKTRSEVVALELAKRGLSAQGAQYVSTLKNAEEKTGQFGKSAFASRNQLLTLQYTISDVIASAGSGISPLTILLQQGGQVFDAFGGANAQGKGGFFKNFIGSIASIVTPARLAVGGLAGAAVTLGAAMLKGAEQSKQFADAIVLSGNFAGLTEGRFNAQIKAIAATGEVSIAAAREIGQALLATGQIGPQVFAKAQEAAARYAQATGKNAKEVADIFAGLAQDPAKAAAELNKTLNFLSASQLQMIRTLQEGGQASQAQAIALDALNGRFKQLDPNLGILDRLLRGTKNTWAEFWDAAFDVGRAETIEQRIAKARAAIANGVGTERVSQTQLSPDRRAQFERLAAQGVGQADQNAETLRLLNRSQSAAEATAANAAETASLDKKATAAAEYYRAAEKGAKLQTGLVRELAEEQKNYDDLLKRKATDPTLELPTDAARKAIQARIRETYTDKSGRNSANDQRKAILERDLKLLQDQLAREQDTLKFNQADLQAIYSASNISLKQFYDEKERLTAEGVERQLVFLRGERARFQVDLDRNQFKDPADRTKTETQRNEAAEKITNLEREAGFAAKLAARERTAGFKALDDQIAEYRANLLQLAGDEAGAAKARADAAIENAKLFAERAGGAISQEQLDRQAFLIAQANEFAEVQRRTGVISADAGRAEETFLLRSAQRGADLQETERGVFQLRSAALEQLGRLTEEAQALAAASTDPKIVQFAKDLELQYARAADAIDPAVLRLRQAGQELSGGIANSLNQTSTNFSSLYGARLETAAKDAAGRRDSLNKQINDLQDTLGKSTNELDRKRLNERILSLQRELASVKEESRFDVLLKTFERDVLKPLAQQTASSIQKVLITDPLQKYIEGQLRGLTENGGALASFFSDISGSRGLNVDKSGLGIDTKGFSQAQDSAAAFELVTTSATAAVSAGDLQTSAVLNSTTALTSMATAANLAAAALSQASISAGGSGFSLSGFSTGSNPNYGNEGRNYPVQLADGTNYVPYDGYRASLHKGESVVPAKYNPAAGGGGKGGNVFITNNAPAEVSAERDSNGDLQVLIEAAANRAHQLVAADHSSGTGPSSRALKSRGVNLNSSLARRG